MASRRGVLACACPDVAALTLPAGLHVFRVPCVPSSGVAVDSQHVYFTERGTPSASGPIDGSVSRVPLGGGKIEQLAGPVRWPSRVAVDDERIYFMSDGAGEVWAIPKSGGPAAIYIPTAPDDYPCRETRWLYAGPTGLKYTRAAWGAQEATLWALPRAAMNDPQQHFRNLAAAQTTPATK